MQPSVLAAGTAFDVDAGQAEHEGGHGFGGRRDDGRRLGEEGAAPRELGATRPVRQEAEMADADKPARHDVEEEATDEFLDVERHDLHAVTIGVVLPAEAHDAVGVADEPLVGDGHAVRVATEVLQELRGAGEGSFGVHDPVRLPQLLKPGGKARRISEGGERAGEDELAGAEGALERVQVLAAEDLGQGRGRGRESRAAR